MAKKHTKPTDKEYTELGKAVQKVFARDYFNVIESRRRFLAISFVRGVITGFGGVIGATLVVALIIWLLNVLDALPLVGDFFNSLKDSLSR